MSTGGSTAPGQGRHRAASGRRPGKLQGMGADGLAPRGRRPPVIDQVLRERPETGFRSAAGFRVALEQAS